MQISQVILADPQRLADDLTALAATNEIQIVQKTYSGGRFIVVSENAAGVGQTIVVIRGDPNDMAAALTAITAGGGSVDIVTPTFSGGYFVVVYR